MKVRISPFQLTLMLTNFIFAGTLISLPQKLVDVTGQNAWFVPFIAFPLVLLVCWVVLAKVPPTFEDFLEKVGNSVSRKVFLSILCLFVSFGFVRDLRATTDFVGTVLLPSTPIAMLTILSLFVLVYISVGGLEVISRLTQIQFFLFATTVAILPFLLLNEVEWANFQPILGLRTVPTLFQSAYLLIPWIGELVIVFFLLGNVSRVKEIRKVVSWSVLLSCLLLLILIIMEISVLGMDITRFATYPNYQLIQEINLTDFLDRLDLVIVTLWVPTIFCKMALSLYCIIQSLTLLKGGDSKPLVLPVTIFLSLLSILLFKNNMTHLEFSFYTWASLGLIMEFLLILCFIWMRKTLHGKRNEGTAEDLEQLK